MKITQIIKYIICKKMTQFTAYLTHAYLNIYYYYPQLK